MQHDLTELLKKYESAKSVVNELEILAIRKKTGSTLSTYNNNYLGGSLLAAQNILSKATQQLNHALETLAQNDVSENSENLTQNIAPSANRFTMPARKLRPVLNIKPAILIDLSAKYLQHPQHIVAPKLSKMQSLLLVIKNLGRKISPLSIIIFLSKRILKLHLQARKNNQIKRQKLKEDKLKKLKRKPKKYKLTPEQIKSIQTEEALQLEYANSLALLNQHAAYKYAFNIRQANVANTQKITLNNYLLQQQACKIQADKHAAALQMYNAEQQNLIYSVQQTSFWQNRVIEYQKYVRVMLERTRIERFLESIIEGALHRARESLRKIEQDKLHKLSMQKAKSTIHLPHADAALDVAQDLNYEHDLDANEFASITP